MAERTVAPATSQLMLQVATAEAPVLKLNTDLQAIITAAPAGFERTKQSEVDAIREVALKGWHAFEKKHWDFSTYVVGHAPAWHCKIMEGPLDTPQAEKLAEEIISNLKLAITKMHDSTKYLSNCAKAATPLQLGKLRKVILDHIQILVSL